MGSGSGMAKAAVEAYRQAIAEWQAGRVYAVKPSAYAMARAYGVKLGEMHVAAQCMAGLDCTGQGCNLGR